MLPLCPFSVAVVIGWYVFMSLVSLLAEREEL